MDKSLAKNDFMIVSLLHYDIKKADATMKKNSYEMKHLKNPCCAT